MQAGRKPGGLRTGEGVGEGLIPSCLPQEQVVEDADLDWGLRCLLRQAESGPQRGRRGGAEMWEGAPENVVQTTLALLTLDKFRE